MDKDTSEIAKLTERISRDPKSKLFVPLAEEYKKAGDLEMAIHVLSEGLKHNSGYVTARSILGRILFEKGDFEEARKEFEEVVKAVPENLLAQRRLGDVHALQDRMKDALQHYRIAAALNPRDQELASLIADIDAGVNIRPRLQQISIKPVSGKIAKVEPEQGAPKREEVVPVTNLPSEETQGHQPATAPDNVVAAGHEAPTPADSSSPAGLPPESVLSAQSITMEEQEVAEEVLVVEPLDEEAAPASSRETTADLGPEVFATELSDTGLVLEEPAGVPEAIPSEATIAAEAPLPVSPPEENPHLSEEQAFLADRQISAPEPSDDFTTDTLAELYIAQGFYEKAIDIYERMLADKPDSRGLQDKLARVRAMAAATEPQPVLGSPVSEEISGLENIESDVAAEASMPVVSATEPETPVLNAEKTKSDAWMAAEAREYVPPPAKPEDEEIEADIIEVNEEDALFAIPGELTLATEAAPEAADRHVDEHVAVDAGLFSEPAAEAEETLWATEQEARPGEAAVPEKNEGASFDIFTTTSPVSPVGTAKGGSEYEPREYVPPSSAPGPDRVEPAFIISKQRSVVGQVAIQRLESWLKNIKKEK